MLWFRSDSKIKKIDSGSRDCEVALVKREPGNLALALKNLSRKFKVEPTALRLLFKRLKVGAMAPRRLSGKWDLRAAVLRWL